MEKILELITKWISKKFETKEILQILDDEKTTAKYISQIQESISYFNSLREEELATPEELINTIHLIKIIDFSLPEYYKIIHLLQEDESLSEKVFDELANSSYFSEVYQIENPSFLLINLLILFYRTSLLHLYPDLRKNKAQISSVVEEIASVNAISRGRDELFEATKHWILNWQEEGFSKVLADKVSKIK